MFVRARFGVLVGLGALFLVSSPNASLAQGMSGAATPQARGPAYDPNAEFHAGVEALGENKYRAAKSHFEHVVAVIPDQATALFLLAQAEAGLNDWRAAARDDEASLHADPHQVFAVRDLVIADEKLGRHDKAQAQLQKLKDRAATCGGSCSEAGDLEGAVRQAEAALTPARTAASSKAPAS
jgi:tetratricopeptide (TPR) repeat protein